MDAFSLLTTRETISLYLTPIALEHILTVLFLLFFAWTDKLRNQHTKEQDKILSMNDKISRLLGD